MKEETRLGFAYYLSSRINIFSERLGVFAAIMLGFWCEISTAGAAIAMGLLYLSFLLTGQWSKKIKLLCHPVMLVALVFFLWVVVGSLYSTGSSHETMTMLMKYSRIFVIWCLLYFISGDNKKLWAVVAAIALGVVANLAAIYLNYFILPQNHAIVFNDPVWPSAQNHFQFAFFTLVFAFSCFIFAFHKHIGRRLKVVLLLVGVVALIAEIGINSARTGYVMEFIVVVLLYAHRYRLKGFLIAMVLSIIIFFTAYQLAPIFKSRVNLAVNSFLQYQDDDNNTTSVGLRLYFYQTCLDVIKAYPWHMIAGFGSGSFKATVAKYMANHRDSYPKNFKVSSFPNPHNQYFLLLIENGVIGLLLFLSVFVVLVRYAQAIDESWKYIFYVIIIGLLVGCAFNSWLMDFGPSVMFWTYTGLLSTLKPGMHVKRLPISSVLDKRSI